MSLTWLSNTNIKKPKRPKPNEKRRREPGPTERERIHAVQSHCRASLRRLAALVPAVPWWFRHIVQSGYVSLLPSSNHLSSSIRRRPNPQARSLHHWPISTFVFMFRYEFRHLCLCFRVDFKLCLCFGMGFDVEFRLGFGLCLHFGFVFWAWVWASLCVSGCVFASCSQSVGFDLGYSYFYSFFGFSDLGFAQIFARFLVFLLFFFFFFCSSSLVLDGFWS